MATDESRKKSGVIEAKWEAVALAVGTAVSVFQPSPEEAGRPAIFQMEDERTEQREVQHQAAEVFASIESARKRQREEEAETASMIDDRPNADLTPKDLRRVRAEGETKPVSAAFSERGEEEATAAERARALVEETRRLEDVLKVMEEDGNTLAEKDSVRRQLSGRYQAIETNAAAREYRNRTGSAEERKRSLAAVRAAQAAKALKV